MPKRLSPTKSLRCPTHGRVDAALVRGSHPIGDIVVDRLAAWLCPHCQAVLAVPHQGSGRIAAARQALATASSKDFRVPLELEDLALAVNAQFGTLGVGEPFTLPLHLGLQFVGNTQSPPMAWRVFDHLEKPVRARPRLHAQTVLRLEGLASLWDATVADVVRWLIVAAWHAVIAGLAVRDVHDDLSELEHDASSP